MSALLLTAGISGGEASTTKYDELYLLAEIALITGALAMVFEILAYGRISKIVMRYIAVLVGLMLLDPHLFFYEKTVTKHAPYTITGTVLKIDKNDSYGDYEPTITLDGGEKVKVKESAKTLYQFIGSKVTLRCKYDAMPEKKITSETSCDFQGAGSAPTRSVSN